MDSGPGIYEFLGDQFDLVLHSFVTSTSQNLCAALSAPFAVAVAIWIFLQGWKILRGLDAASISDLAWQAFRIAAIAATSLSAGLYQDWICDSVNGITDQLAATLSGHDSSVFQSLDVLDQSAGSLANEFLKRGEESAPMGGYGDMLCGLIIVIANGLMLVIMGGYALLARVAVSILLAIGPLFLASLLFQRSAQLCANWLGLLVSFVLLSAMTSLLIGLSLHIGGSYYAAAATQDATLLSAVRELSKVMLLSGALAVVALQLPRVAAGLGGSIALRGESQHLSTAYTAVRARFGTLSDAARSAAGLQAELWSAIKEPIATRFYTSKFYRFQAGLIRKLSGKEREYE